MTDSGEQQAAGRRRIDRIVDPSYLEGLDSRDAAELRTMRNDCQVEEARLSYQRRLLQGKLDIVRAEAARRGGDGPGLIDALPKILADEPTERPREARATTLYTPPVSRRDEDDVLSGDLSRLPDLSDDELAALAAELAEAEREVSDLRNEVLRRLDELQAGLIGRYRSGGVLVDEILAGSGSGPQPGTGLPG